MRAIAIAAGVGVVFSGCKSERADPAHGSAPVRASLEPEGEPQGPTVVDRLRMEVRAGAENLVAVPVLPNAKCLLRPGGDASSLPLKLSSGDDGVVSFSYESRSVGVPVVLSVTCTDAADTISATREIELRGSTEVAPLTAQPPRGRVRPALQNPDALTSDQLHEARCPSRPDPVKSPDAYAKWYDFVTHPAIDLSPPSPAVGRYASFPEYATFYYLDNWAGIKGYPIGHPSGAKGGAPLLAIMSAWAVPSVTAEGIGETDDAVFWVGLGDASSAFGGGQWQGGLDLKSVNWVYYQNGQFVTVNVTTRKWWWELLVPECTSCDPTATPTCCIKQQPIPNFPDPHAGDTVFTELWFGDASCAYGLTGNDNTQTVAYYYANATQGLIYSECFYVSDVLYYQSPPRSGPSGITGGSAEWVLERHPKSYPLAGFSDVTMSSPMAYDLTNGWTFFAGLPGWTTTTPESYWMTDNGLGCVSDGTCGPGNLLAIEQYTNNNTQLLFRFFNYQ